MWSLLSHVKLLSTLDEKGPHSLPGSSSPFQEAHGQEELGCVSRPARFHPCQNSARHTRQQNKHRVELTGVSASMN